MDAGLSDERLVARASDGDIAAFNLLVERYQSSVYTLCLRLLGHRQAAEDATQEALLSAYRAIQTFAGGNFRSWVLRIAANECKDELRRRSRKDRADSLDVMFDSEDRPVEVADPSPGADFLLLRAEEASALHSILLHLPEDQRQVVTLVDVYEFRYDEVAELLHLSLGTVKSRVFRARERLRQAVLANPELFPSLRRSVTQEHSP